MYSNNDNIRDNVNDNNINKNYNRNNGVEIQERVIDQCILFY